MPGSDLLLETSVAPPAQIPRWKQHQLELQKVAREQGACAKKRSKAFRKASTVYNAAENAHIAWFRKIGKGARPSRPQNPSDKLRKMHLQQMKLLKAELVWYGAYALMLESEKLHLEDTVALRDAKIRELRAQYTSAQEMKAFPV